MNVAWKKRRLTQVAQPPHQHHESLQPYRKSSVRRHSKAKGLQIPRNFFWRNAFILRSPNELRVQVDALPASYQLRPAKQQIKTVRRGWIMWRRHGVERALDQGVTRDEHKVASPFFPRIVTQPSFVRR